MIISFVPDTELMALTVCLGDCDDPHQMRPGKLSLHSRQTVTIKIQFQCHLIRRPILVPQVYLQLNKAKCQYKNWDDIEMFEILN